jgi:hypothetical protein
VSLTAERLRLLAGNELNINLKESNTTRLGAAFARLHSVISDIWGGGGGGPLVMGPDVSWVHDQPGDKEGTRSPNRWLKDFLSSFRPAACVRPMSR